MTNFAKKCEYFAKKFGIKYAKFFRKFDTLVVFPKKISRTFSREIPLFSHFSLYSFSRNVSFAAKARLDINRRN